MAKKNWKAFPYPNKAFDYAGDKLAKAWPRLHAGDQEPFPDVKHIDVLLKAHPKLGKDAASIAAQLQDAWRDFHRGDFQQAYDTGVALKALGASVAIKAAGIHAAYLVDDDAAKTARYEDLVRLADEALVALRRSAKQPLLRRGPPPRGRPLCPPRPRGPHRQGRRIGGMERDQFPKQSVHPIGTQRRFRRTKAET